LYITGISEEDRTLSDHNINLVLGNQALGRWVKRSPFENPYVLANQMGSWLHNWKSARKDRNRYEDAPAIRQINEGEMKFRNLCTSCHVISGGIASIPNTKQVGPDLFAVVENRDRAWLERWLAEPEVMIREKDPLATALKEQYKVMMPNFRLSPQDIQAIIGYLDDETQRLRKVADQKASEQDPLPEISG
jgi:protein SCO1/2